MEQHDALTRRSSRCCRFSEVSQHPSLGEHHHIALSKSENPHDSAFLNAAKNGGRYRDGNPRLTGWDGPYNEANSASLNQLRCRFPPLPFRSAMGRKEATAEELLARAKANGYQRGAHWRELSETKTDS